MQFADRLRVGPWVPEPGRHAGGDAMTEVTAEQRLYRPRADESPAWLLDLSTREDGLDDAGRHHRGGRRTTWQPPILVTVTVLAVAAAILLVVSVSPRDHRGTAVVAAWPAASQSEI